MVSRLISPTYPLLDSLHRADKVMMHLGPQCLSCRRRRVKCDSSQPTCQRCRRDAALCPGYEKGFHWVLVDPSLPARRRKRRAGKPPTEGVSDATNREDMVLFRSPAWSGDEREELLALAATNDYNQFVIPDLIPDALPFRRSNFEASYWPGMPNLLRRMLIFTVQAYQTQPKTPSNDVCRYRALSLSKLRKCLPSAMDDPAALVLMAILMFMVSEMRVGSKTIWTMHHHAAKRIIAHRGGFEVCWITLPFARRLLVAHMMVDILEAATQPVSQMQAVAVKAQSQYSLTLKRRDDNLILNTFLHPLEILQSLIRINQLRIGGDMSGIKLIHDSIMAFDASGWADYMMTYGDTLPQRRSQSATASTRIGWIALGLCHKFAALLYLNLSTSSRSANAPVHLVWHSLSQQLQALFSIASTDIHDSRIIETCLWKFVSWPLTIAVYVLVIYGDAWENQESCEDRPDLSKLVNPLLDVDQLAMKIRERVERKHNVKLCWGDGLDGDVMLVI